MGAGASSITELPEDQQLAAFKELQRTYEDGVKQDEDAIALIRKLAKEYDDTLDHQKKKKPGKRAGMFQKGLRMSELAANKKESIEQTEKSDETMALLRTSVMDTLFEDQDARTIEEVLKSMTMRQIEQGDVVCKQGTTDAKFTVIETGKVEVKKDNRHQVYLNRGNMFGEMSLIFDEESPFEYVAKEEGVIWELDRDTFRQVQHVCAAKTLNERAKWISGIELLSRLTKPQLAKVARALQAKQVPKGKDIVTQGEMGDTFYIIQEGRVEVLVTDKRQASEDTPLTPRAVDEMAPGDYFGEAALLTHEPRNATCRALTDVVVLALHSDDFSELLGPLAEILDRNAIVRALQNVDELSALNKIEIDKVADLVEVVTFEAGVEQIVITAGDVSPALFVVREGNLQCLDESGAVIAEMHDGLNFGSACARDEPEKLTVRTTGKACKLCKVSVDNLKAVLGLGGEFSIIQASPSAVGANDGAAGAKGGVKNRRGSKLMCSGPMTKIAMSSLQQLAVLGEGSFGQVTMVKTEHPETGEEVVLALKRMCKQHIIESGQQEHIQRERRVLASIPENVFLLNLHATYQDTDCIYMLTNLLQGGELFSLIHTFDGDIPLPVHQAKFYAANVFLALEHLHNHGVIYRDMKPENILLADDGYLCVIDLGFAKFVPYETTDGPSGTDITLHDLTYTMCGTPEYMAPEFVLQTGHNAGADYWSLGILVYEMFFARTPFLPEDEDMGQLFKNIAAVRTQQQRTATRDARPSMLRFDPDFEEKNADAVQIVCQLLNGNPNYRLGMLRNGSKDVRNHPWFSDMDWDAMLEKRAAVPFKPKIKNKYDTSCFDDEDVGQLEVIPFEGIDGDVFKSF